MERPTSRNREKGKSNQNKKGKKNRDKTILLKYVYIVVTLSKGSTINKGFGEHQSSQR